MGFFSSAKSDMQCSSSASQQGEPHLVPDCKTTLRHNVSKVEPIPVNATRKDAPLVIIISAVVNTVLILSLFAPLIYDQPPENDFNVYDSFSLWANLVSSFVWLFYSITVLKGDRILDLLICNTASYVMSCYYLMTVYRNKNLKIKAIVLFIFTVITLGAMFALIGIDLDNTKLLQDIFGALGFVMVLVCLGTQLLVMTNSGVRELQKKALVCTILPNLFMSIWTVIYTKMYHSERIYILMSSAVSCGGNIVDLVILVVCHYKRDGARPQDNTLHENKRGDGPTELPPTNEGLRPDNGAVGDDVVRHEPAGSTIGDGSNGMQAGNLSANDELDTENLNLNEANNHHREADDQAMAPNQGWGRFIWATLQSVRGKKHLGDEEGGVREDEVQHALPIRMMFVLINGTRTTLGGSFLGRFIMSAASIFSWNQVAAEETESEDGAQMTLRS